MKQRKYRQVGGMGTLHDTSSYSRHRRRGYKTDKCPCCHQLTPDTDTPAGDSTQCQPLCRGTAAIVDVHSVRTGRHLPAPSPDTNMFTALIQYNLDSVKLLSKKVQFSYLLQQNVM